MSWKFTRKLMPVRFEIDEADLHDCAAAPR